MDTHQLRVFLAVYKYKSFSRASVKLGLKQPTVSTHVKSLEKQLGCRLFDRTSQKVIPTAEARVLFEHAEAVVQMMVKLENAMKCSTKAISGEVIIGSSTIPAVYILPSAASSFRAKHPGVSFRFYSGDSKLIAEMVHEHELLAGVVGARFTMSGLMYQPFIEDELIFVGHPSILKVKELSVSALKGLPFVLREEGSGTRRVMETYFSQKGIDTSALDVAVTLGSTDAVKQAVKTGLGVSVVSRIAVAEDLKRKELNAAVISGLPMTRNFFIATHKGRTLPSVYKAFLEHISHRRAS